MFNKIFWLLRALVYKPFFGSLGWKSYLGKPIIIIGARKVFLGKRVRIFPHFRMEVHGDKSFIKIMDNVGIGQNFHVTSGGELSIHSNCTILPQVMITNIDHEYQEIDIPILDQPHIVNKTEIGEYSFIGMGARIQAGTILGKQCVVGANAVVRGNFPDYCVIVGAPARIVKRYNPKSKKWEKTDKDGNFINQ